jgi:hypothetical protein
MIIHKFIIYLYRLKAVLNIRFIIIRKFNKIHIKRVVMLICRSGIGRFGPGRQGLKPRQECA